MLLIKSEKIALQNAQNSYQLALVEYENTKKQNAKNHENVIDKQSYEDMKAKFDAANLNLIKQKSI